MFNAWCWYGCCSGVRGWAAAFVSSRSRPTARRVRAARSPQPARAAASRRAARAAPRARAAWGHRGHRGQRRHRRIDRRIHGGSRRDRRRLRRKLRHGRDGRFHRRRRPGCAGVHPGPGVPAREPLPRRPDGLFGRAAPSPARIPRTAQGNGIVCGRDMVCNNGACAACAAGTACTPTNPCRTGTIACKTGNARLHRERRQPNGTSCGTGWSAAPGSAGPARRTPPARQRPIPATRERCRARRDRPRARTRNERPPRERLRHGQGLQRHRRPATTARSGRPAPSPASPAGRAHHLQHRRAGVRGIGERPGRHLLRNQHGVQRRQLRVLHGGSVLHADEPLPRGRRPARRRSPAPTPAGTWSTARPAGRTRSATTACAPPARPARAASPPTPARPARRRARPARPSARRRATGERHVVRDQQGLQQRHLRVLHGGRHLHARPTPATRDAHLQHGYRDLPGRGHRPSRTARAAGRTRSARPGAASPAPPGAPARRRILQVRDDLLLDRVLPLRGQRQQAGRHAVRRGPVVHGRRADLGRRCATRAPRARPP